MALDVDSRKFFIGDFDPFGVFPLIQFGTHCKTSVCCGAGDQLDDCSIAAQWFFFRISIEHREPAEVGNSLRKELKTDDHIRYKVVTPEGEIFFRIEADINTGVIDMYGGPAQDKMAYWLARVVERPGHGSLLIFSAMQYPGVSDEAFAAQCEGLNQEFVHIKAHVDQ